MTDTAIMAAAVLLLGGSVILGLSLLRSIEHSRRDLREMIATLRAQTEIWEAFETRLRKLEQEVRRQPTAR